MSSFQESVSRRKYLKTVGAAAASGLFLPSDIEKFSEELNEIQNEFSEAKETLENKDEYLKSARINLKSINEFSMPNIEREIPLTPLVNQTDLEREDLSENTNPSKLYERAKERDIVPNPASQFESLAFENEYSVRVHPIYDPFAEQVDIGSREMLKGRIADASEGLDDLRREFVPGNYDIDVDVTEGITLEQGSELEKAVQEFDRNFDNIWDFLTFGIQELKALETLRDNLHDQPGAVPIFITNHDFGPLYGKGGRKGAIVSEGSRDSFEKFQATFIHEEIHGFGGPHSAHRDSIMAQPYNPESSGLGVGERLISYFDRIVSGEEELRFDWKVSQEPAKPVLKQKWLTENLSEPENLKEQRKNFESYVRDMLGFERIEEMTFAGRSLKGDGTVMKYQDSVGENSYEVEFQMDEEGYLDDMEMSIQP